MEKAMWIIDSQGETPEKEKSFFLSYYNYIGRDFSLALPSHFLSLVEEIINMLVFYCHSTTSIAVVRVKCEEQAVYHMLLSERRKLSGAHAIHLPLLG
jgi:hypothetical protein